MGTLLCAFRKNLPRSIAPLNVIKVLINIHAQHLYSKHLIIALKKKGMGEERGRNYCFPLFQPKEFKATKNMHLCTNVLKIKQYSNQKLREKGQQSKGA